MNTQGESCAQEMKRIYIVLTQPHSVVAKALQLFSKKPYNHASISFCDNLSEMYSFGRKFVHFPMIGGFVRESCDFGFFNRFYYTECSVYAIDVTEKQYQCCLQSLETFKQNPGRYKYNHLGLLTIPLHIPYSMENHFVCSHFVAHLLGESNIVRFSKDVRLITPWDLANIQGAKGIYKGNLNFFSQKMA